MSIIWKKKVKDPETGVESYIYDKETHVGLVMGESYVDHDVRVMSDIWADVTRVKVWNPDTEQPETVNLQYHFELNSKIGTSTKDCPQDIIDEWEASEKLKAAEAERVRQEQALAAHLEACKERVLEPQVGERAIIYKGRKVPKGTTGVIFYKKEGHYGIRVGLKDFDGKSHWTSMSNVRRLLPGLPYGTDPAEGWENLELRLARRREEWEKQMPSKGDPVTILASGVTGEIIWRKGSRLGVKRDGASRDEDLIWTDAWEVSLPEDGGRIPPQSPEPFFVEPEGDQHPLHDYPHPFNHIRYVSFDDKTHQWKAFDAESEFIMIVPDAGMRDILTKLEGSA